MSLEEVNISSNSQRKIPTAMDNLNSLVKFVLKRWWLFLIIGLLSGGAGFYYASLQKPTYKSKLTFALDDNSGGSGGIGNFLNLASQFGLNIGGGKDIFAGDNILEIMKSRRMVERVLLSVDTFNNKSYTLIEYFYLITKRRQNNPKIRDIDYPVGQSKSSFSYRQDSLLYTTAQEFTNNYITAERPDRKLGIYEVSVKSEDEKFTKDFTDRIVSETNKFYIEIRTKKAKETLDILEQRVADMRGNLNSSISNRATAQDINVNPAFSAAQVPVLKQQTNIQVYGAAYGEMFKNLELARFQYLNEIPLMQIIDPADYPMIKIKLGKLKTALVFTFFAELLLLSVLGMRKLFKK